MLGCIQHNFFEGPFSQQLGGDLPHLIKVSGEVADVVAITSFWAEMPRPILTSIRYSAFEEDLRIARQKNLDWIELHHESVELGVDGNCR